MKAQPSTLPHGRVLWTKQAEVNATPMTLLWTSY